MSICAETVLNIDCMQRYKSSDLTKCSDFWTDIDLPAIIEEDSANNHISCKRIGWFDEFFILQSRAFKLVLREPRITYIAIIQSLFVSYHSYRKLKHIGRVLRFAIAYQMALITGTLYYDLTFDQTGIKNRLGGLFFMALNAALGTLQPTLIYFHYDKPVFDRERIAGSYRVSTYFMSSSFANLPIVIAPLIV